jgi:hypothetical protein
MTGANQERPKRRYRLGDGDTRSRTISLPAKLYEAIAEEAAAQGHNNISWVLQLAAIDYLNKRRDPRAA